MKNISKAFIMAALSLSAFGARADGLDMKKVAVDMNSAMAKACGVIDCKLYQTVNEQTLNAMIEDHAVKSLASVADSAGQASAALVQYRRTSNSVEFQNEENVLRDISIQMRALATHVNFGQ